MKKRSPNNNSDKKARHGSKNVKGMKFGSLSSKNLADETQH